MLIMVHQLHALALVARARGKAIRSNYTGGSHLGDIQIHWKALDPLVRAGLIMRVGRHYSPTIAGEAALEGRVVPRT